MVVADGSVIQPTGKKYHLPMATLGRWNNQGVMDEEYLFWDNATHAANRGRQVISETTLPDDSRISLRAAIPDFWRPGLEMARAWRYFSPDFHPKALLNS